MERILNKHERGELVRRVARMIKRRTKNTRQLRKELGSFNALCPYCPWTDGRVRHLPWKYCYLRSTAMMRQKHFMMKNAEKHQPFGIKEEYNK